MKEIPILFNTLMVQANMEDRKGMTRRLSNMEAINENPDKWSFQEKFTHVGKYERDKHVYRFVDGEGSFIDILCPYGKPGDILWVRETYKNVAPFAKVKGEEMFVYKADDPEAYPGMKWKPSIHMQKRAARIWLQVESVRVERLKDISDNDAIAEGIESYTILDDLIGYKNYSENARKDFLNKSHYQFDNMKEIQSGPVASFCTLWISINGRESWISNPWVWVIKYKILSKTGRPASFPEYVKEAIR